MCVVLINYWEERLRAALAMVKKKPHLLSFIHPGAREKAINPSLSGARPTAHQPRKIRNQTPTNGAQEETSNKYMGKNEQENPCRRDQQNK